MLHRLLHFRLTVLLTLGILVVCLLPVPETPLENVRFIDKYTHILLFGGYAWVLWCESACFGAVLCAKVVWKRVAVLSTARYFCSPWAGLRCSVGWSKCCKPR